VPEFLLLALELIESCEYHHCPVSRERMEPHYLQLKERSKFRILRQFLLNIHHKAEKL
jgi:hypothetical protein